METRIVAYDPFGDRRGVVPFLTRYDWTSELNVRSTMTLTCQESALKSNYLEGGEDAAEVALEYRQVQRGAWQEARWGRLLVIDRDRDVRSEAGLITYAFLSIGFMLEKALVYVADTVDPALGAVRPERTFTNDTPGQIIRVLFLAAQARGWGAGLTLGFNGTQDAAGVAWPETIEELVVSPFDTIQSVLDRLVEARYVDYQWVGRELRLYIADDFLKNDKTTDPGAVVLRYVGGKVTAAPEKATYADLATDVLVALEDGRMHPVAAASPASPYGRMERGLDASGILGTAQANKAAKTVLAVGRAWREQVTYTCDGDSRVWPFRDVETGDEIQASRGPEHDSPNGKDRHPATRVYQMRVMWAATSGLRWDFTCGDRIHRRDGRALQRLGQLVGGKAGWGTGEVRPPGDDPRRPDVPTALAITPSRFPNQAGKSRAQFAFLATAPETAPNQFTGVSEPIELGAIHLFHEAGGVGGYKRIRSWEDPTDTITDNNGGAGYDPAITHRFKVKSESHAGVKSQLSAAFTASQAADLDPVPGAELILDSPFRNADLATARTTDAGAGFTFGTSGGRRVGRFPTTTPVLNLAIDGQGGKGGRLQVAEGDVLTLSGWQRYTGTGTASGRARVRFHDQAGATVGAAVTAYTTAAGTSWARTSGAVTVPADAVTAEVWHTASTQTGSAVLEVRDPGAARQATSDRIHLTDNLGASHTVTGPYIQTHSTSTVGSKMSSSGIYHYVSGVAAFSATASGVSIKGDLTVGSNITGATITAGTISGTAISGVTIAGVTITGGTFTTGTGNIVITGDTISVGSNTISFSGALVTFSAGIAVGGSAQVSSTLSVTGSTTLGGTFDHNGSTFGAIGAAPAGVQTPGAAATDLASVITLANNLRTGLQNFGFFA